MPNASTPAERRARIAAQAAPSADQLRAAIEAAGDGRIYFVQMDDYGPIKVGYTTAAKLTARLSVIQTGNPFEIHLRRVIPGTRLLEARIHRLFVDLWMRSEWFWPAPELAAVAHGFSPPFLKPQR